MVSVEGTVNGAPLAAALTEPVSPFAGQDLTSGEPTVVTVGPYTNSSAVSQSVTGMLVSNAVGVTVNSTAFNQDGSEVSDPVTVEAGSTVSVDVNVTADTIADGETTPYSFDIADLTATPSE